MHPEEIIYTSFTRAACKEAMHRALSSSEMAYRKDDFPWFKTEHAICFKLLGLKKDYVFTDKRIQEFGDRYPIYKFTNHGSSFEERHFEMMLQSLGDYYEFFVNWMDNNMMPFSAAIREFMKKQVDLPDEFSVAGAKTYMERRDNFKQEHCLWDFSDMIYSVAERRLCPEFKVLVADECQDCSPLLWNLIQMWADNALRSYIGADPYQCVPEGTKISTPSGDVPVETLKKGDKVSCSYGSGHAGIGEIIGVHTGDSSDTRIVITTKSGKKVKLTSKHQLFSLMPLFRAAPQRKTGCFYVYLMYKAEIGWRIGLTNQPSMRIRGEGCAPVMHILASFPTWEEGMYHEELWSLKYGIPTQTFIAHDKRQFIVGDLLKKMCDELNVNDRVQKLAEDLGIDLRYPIHIPQSTTLRNPVRVVVNVRMTTLNDHHIRRFPVSQAAGWHWLRVETSDAVWQQKLQDMGFKLSEKKRVLRIWSKDLAYIMSIVNRLAQEGALIKIGHIAKGSTQPGILTVAGNIMRGYKIPILDGEDMIWDEVVDVKREFNFGKVYDLDIAHYHNYIAEGVMVHNSIYGFAGANPELFESFEGVLSTLPHSYRLTPQVKDYAEKIIGLTNLKLPYFTVDTNKVGQVSTGQIQSIDWLNTGSTFVLARTRRQLREIGDRLKIMGVPFAQERLGESPIESSKGMAFLTLLKLAAREKVHADELRALAKHTRNPWLVHGAKTKIKDLVQMEYSFQQVSHFFSQNFMDVIKKDFMDVLCQDIDEADKSYLHRVYKKCGTAAFLKKPDITLTTIHGSKGRQAETVIISPELGRRAYDNFMVDKRSEVFVAYVAATRSMKRVIILQRETPESFPYPRPT